MYRTARRVLNPNFTCDFSGASACANARKLAADGGIENLFVFLGANNVLGTASSLTIKPVSDGELGELPHLRSGNFYSPQQFSEVYSKFANELKEIAPAPTRTILGTVPHATIPPITRGVRKDSLSPGGQSGRSYYEYYIRPWIRDDDFDKDLHTPYLTREDAIHIDATIDHYNATIREVANANNWLVFDLCTLLDSLAYRSNQANPAYIFPAELIASLDAHKRSEKGQ